MEKSRVDFLEPIFKHMFLLIVNAYLKWLQGYPVKITTALKTTECLSDSFACYGLLVMVDSDNGPQFTSDELKKFMQNNGGIHKRVHLSIPPAVIKQKDMCIV